MSYQLRRVERICLNLGVSCMGYRDTKNLVKILGNTKKQQQATAVPSRLISENFIGVKCFHRKQGLANDWW